ncbi:hypothetical protein LK994_06455 [Ferruginibacter lapsinanis]|uniref:hypothetical protein n=1 Tax=Ferruginibacter lapsinanis TaxID=563172 RepID=UPI001E2C5A14|nr:hypothetical protein [Ferruginibacter lapsinanis]UEG51113.1 hypothetical protein LK994_06455 [Ferruginibacter lapsinanis]
MMAHRDIFLVIGVTFYLFVYNLLLQFENTLHYATLMLLFSPLLICWMVYTVLKHGKYNGKKLDKDEFGYQDKSKADLKMF